jgi:hypothetical protein
MMKSAMKSWQNMNISQQFDDCSNIFRIIAMIIFIILIYIISKRQNPLNSSENLSLSVNMKFSAQVGLLLSGAMLCSMATYLLRVFRGLGDKKASYLLNKQMVHVDMIAIHLLEITSISYSLISDSSISFAVFG